MNTTIILGLVLAFVLVWYLIGQALKDMMRDN